MKETSAGDIEFLERAIHISRKSDTIVFEIHFPGGVIDMTNNGPEISSEHSHEGTNIPLTHEAAVRFLEWADKADKKNIISVLGVLGPIKGGYSVRCTLETMNRAISTV